MREIDFTSCPRIPSRAYNGANGKKIAVCSEPGLVEALDRLLPRIHALDILALLDKTPYLTDIQRMFLTTYLVARRDRIFA